MKNKKSKKFRKPVFGVQKKRFQTTGLHPGLLRTVENDSSPCDYKPKSPTCVRRTNVNNWEPWKVQLESEEYSKNLGYQHSELLQKKAFYAGHLGPGSHEIDFALFKQASVSPCLNQNLGKVKRFKKFPDDSPGPGRYLIKPYTQNVPHEGQTFSKSERFQQSEKPWSLACNRYKVLDPYSMDALVKKVVSKRGPYDLFTGPRQPENMFNKFSKAKRCTPDKYYAWPSDIDNLFHHKSNKLKGQFLKANRFPVRPTVRNMLNDISLCYRNPNDPSPATYYIRPTIRSKPEQMYPFATGCLDVRPPVKWAISPGPGRYNIRQFKCYSHKNPTCVFASKTKRAEYKATAYNAF